MRELILGGQKSGKSRLAEERASSWLAAPGHQAVLLATAQALDDEMAARIERHRRDRALRVPALRTAEPGGELARALVTHGDRDTLVVVDCLTLWLTQHMMPLQGPATPGLAAQTDALLEAVASATGPVVLVSNEIALGLVATDAATRRFVDAVGLLHQRLAAVCERVTLVVAGCALTLKPTR